MSRTFLRPCRRRAAQTEADAAQRAGRRYDPAYHDGVAPELEESAQPGKDHRGLTALTTSANTSAVSTTAADRSGRLSIEFMFLAYCKERIRVRIAVAMAFMHRISRLPRPPDQSRERPKSRSMQQRHALAFSNEVSI
jgi:hypothetical protein